jgi:hypothetical protein
VEYLRVPERELALAQRGDEERRRVARDLRELLLGAVQIPHGAAVVVLVMRRDHPLRDPVQRAGGERKGQHPMIASERGGNRHGRLSF